MRTTTTNVIHTPWFVVAAWSTRMKLCTIHGCRPTSATVHPASIETTDAIPAIDAARRNHLLFGMLRWNNHDAPYQSESRSNAVAIPTIRSQARCTVLTCASVGSSFAGTVFRPWTTVFLPVRGSDNHDARPGILIPPVTVPSEFRRPS